MAVTKLKTYRTAEEAAEMATAARSLRDSALRVHRATLTITHATELARASDLGDFAESTKAAYDLAERHKKAAEAYRDFADESTRFLEKYEDRPN